MLINKQGATIFHFGAIVWLLILITLFVVISLLAPQVAAKITAALSNLASSIAG